MNQINTRKEPWIAATLSFILPGLGQIYASRYIRGLLAMLIYSLLTSASFYFFVFSDLKPRITIPLLHLCLSALVMIVIDAHKLARANNDPDFEAIRKSAKDPYFAMFLSFLFPCLGHLYLRNWFGAVLIVVIFFIMPNWLYLGPPYIDPPWFCLEIIFTIGICIHIWWISKKTRQIPLRPAIILGAVAQTATIIISLASAVIVFNICQVYRLPKGGGMNPTLFAGDRMIVDKTAWESFERGDIIVYYSPDDYDVYFVQRVIAFENETVEIKKSGILINGRKTDFPTLNTQEMSSKRTTYALKGDPYTVPQGHIFVVGDHLKNSYDSRYFGPIPDHDVIGVAHKIIWPINRTKMLR